MEEEDGQELHFELVNARFSPNKGIACHIVASWNKANISSATEMLNNIDDIEVFECIGENDHDHDHDHDYEGEEDNHEEGEEEDQDDHDHNEVRHLTAEEKEISEEGEIMEMATPDDEAYTDDAGDEAEEI